MAGPCIYKSEYETVTILTILTFYNCFILLSIFTYVYFSCIGTCLLQGRRQKNLNKSHQLTSKCNGNS